MSDPYFSNVGLLLHGDGADAGTTIIDSSSTPKTPSVTSVTTSTTLAKFGGASLRFATSGSLLSYPHDAAFQPTGDFCVEAFALIPATTGGIRVVCWKGTGTGAYPFYIYINASGFVQANAFGGGAVLVSLLSTGALSANAWHHIAFDRNGSTFRLFINGILEATGTSSGAVHSNSEDPLVIGNTSTGAYGLGSGGAAYIDEFRVTLSSRYTANFSPPTEAFGGPIEIALSGVVRDAADAPAARLVRAVREDTGAAVGSVTSDAVTGAYIIATTYAGAHTLNAYPAAGENLPALTLRGVVPV